jgi:peptidoglycan-N-acetylmuramic acid deacetylase
MYTAEFDITQFDCRKQGYGMGHEVDSENVPKGAADFNGAYSEYSAYALNNSDNVILTFDNGYENGLTAGILDTLKEKGVKAIFFVTGDYVTDNKKLVQRIIDEGHILGNHGMDHESLPDLTYGEIVDELMSLHNLVKDEFGYEMSYMRPPKGEFSEASLAAAQNLGYTTLLWSFAYVDWEQANQPSESAAYEKICDCVHPGEIALLHAVSSANAEVLPEVIDYVRSLGLDFEIPETTAAETDLTIFVRPDTAHRIYSRSPLCACV